MFHIKLFPRREKYKHTLTIPSIVMDNHTLGIYTHMTKQAK